MMGVNPNCAVCNPVHIGFESHSAEESLTDFTDSLERV